MLIMESNPKSAILFQMQLHPNDSFRGEGNILFPPPSSPPGNMKPGLLKGADTRQFFSEAELLFLTAVARGPLCLVLSLGLM